MEKPRNIGSGSTSPSDVGTNFWLCVRPCDWVWAQNCYLAEFMIKLGVWQHIWFICFAPLSIFSVIADAQADRCPSLTASSPESPPRRPSFTRSGSVRYQESEESPECNDKPSGKRKFKSKHLCDSDEQKVSFWSCLLDYIAVLIVQGSTKKRLQCPPVVWW